MNDFCQIIFSSDFIPRGHCGGWNPTFVWLYVLSNCMVFAAYMAIPFVLGMAHLEMRKGRAAFGITRRQITHSRITFAIFILLCGVGHLLDGALSFFYPYYHFFAVWHALTAVASWAAVFMIVKIRHYLIPGI